jgi:hypothetical protein
VLAGAFRGAGCRGLALRYPDFCLISLSLSLSLSFALSFTRARTLSRCLSRSLFFSSRSIDCPRMEQVDIEIVTLYQKELVTPDLLPVGDMVFAELASTIEHVKMVRNTF